MVTVSLDVNSVAGLPNTFASRIQEFATEFDIKYTVLRAADDGIDDIDTIRERVLANVRVLLHEQEDAVADAIDRLITKRSLERDGKRIRRR